MNHYYSKISRYRNKFKNKFKQKYNQNKRKKWKKRYKRQRQRKNRRKSHSNNQFNKIQRKYQNSKRKECKWNKNDHTICTNILNIYVKIYNYQSYHFNSASHSTIFLPPVANIQCVGENLTKYTFSICDFNWVIYCPSILQTWTGPS
jgi:hypothetical protein